MQTLEEKDAAEKAAADPDALFKSTLEGLDPAVRAALETRDRNLKRAAGRASAEAKVASGNYASAEAWARVAQAAIERARGAGADVSDLAAGEVADAPDAGGEYADDFNLMSVTEEATKTLGPEFTEKLLAGYDEADDLASAAADLAAAGDTARADALKKKARSIRGQLIAAQVQSAVWAASGVMNRMHQHWGGQFGGLRSQIDTGVGEATNNDMVVGALEAATSAVNDETGQRKWFENGFFVQNGTRVSMSELGRELIGPMTEWAADRGLDLRDPEAFDDAFTVALRRSGRLRRAGSTPATTPAPRGDATSALAGHGAPSVATPSASSPSARHQESASELAARKNRNAFASR